MSPDRFDELRVVTSTRWLAQDLAAGTALPVVADLGLDLPTAGVDRAAWWCSGQFATRLAASGVHATFTGPDATLVAALPEQLTGRVLLAASAGQLRAGTGPVAGLRSAFVKLADVKHPGVPARWWDDLAGAVAMLDAADVPPETALIVCPTRVDFVSEHRCFITEGQVAATSVYVHEDVTWDGLDSSALPSSAEAVRFATEVLAVVGDQPEGWVLDVGCTSDGRWCVVEANPSWCANPYHADPAGAVASILAGQGHPADRWAWTGGRLLSRWARPLPVRSG